MASPPLFLKGRSKKMFHRNEISPYSVTDKIIFRNVDDTLQLIVRADAASLVMGLKKVNERLSQMTDETPEEERLSTALFFAQTLFGKDQGENLCQFYGNDPLAIINACGMYFRERLSKKITKVQKK